MADNPSSRPARKVAVKRAKRTEGTHPEQQAVRVVAGLAQLYPHATCALVHTTPYQLIVATILSAQCTDARVNQITPALFENFPDPHALAAAETAELEELIRPTGFYHAKGKNLLGMAQALVDRHDGIVPPSLDALTNLPGVGRKTANVVLGTAFAIPSGVVVDTHVKRLSHRLGLTDHTDPEHIEQDLAAIIPRSEWINLSHRLIHHGRAVCSAQNPRCEDCGLAEICPKRGIASASKPKKATPTRAKRPKE